MKIRENKLVAAIIDPIAHFWVKQKSLIKYKKLLDRNKELVGKYQGRRCFVVGNGPSLKNQDLTKLKGEVVFTVNWMMRSPLFDTLKPTYHVIIDKLGFNFDIN